MFKLFSVSIFLMAYAPLMTFSTRKTAPQPPPPVYDPPPLRAFTAVVNSFKDNAILAQHKCVVETWTTKTGCMFVSFETEMTSDDTPRSLCYDMYNYINKNNWMENVTPSCKVKCNRLTLILEGKDDPNYDPSKEATKRPLEALGEILRDGFAKGAQLGDYVCDCNVYQNDHDCWHIEIDTVITDLSLTCHSVCDNIVAYLDKPGILNGSTRTCQFVDGCPDKVRLHLIGS